MDDILLLIWSDPLGSAILTILACAAFWGVIFSLAKFADVIEDSFNGLWK